MVRADDPRAIEIMERDRLGRDYIEDEGTKCPVCETENPEYLYYSDIRDEYVGCEHCIEREKQ